jgi:hypothetical protein
LIVRVFIYVAVSVVFVVLSVPPATAESISTWNLNYGESAFRLELVDPDMSPEFTRGQIRFMSPTFFASFSMRASLFDRCNFVVDVSMARTDYRYRSRCNPMLIIDETDRRAGSYYMGFELYTRSQFLMLEIGLWSPADDGENRLARYVGRMARPSVPGAFRAGFRFVHLRSNVQVGLVGSSLTLRTRLGVDLGFPEYAGWDDRHFLRHGVGLYGSRGRYLASLSVEGSVDMWPPGGIKYDTRHEVNASLGYRLSQFAGGVFVSVPLENWLRQYADKAIGFFVTATL